MVQLLLMSILNMGGDAIYVCYIFAVLGLTSLHLSLLKKASCYFIIILKNIYLAAQGLSRHT